MASETPGDASVSVSLPESLSRWLDDKAQEEDLSREDVLLQLLSAYRKIDGLEEGEIDPVEGVGVESLEQLPADLREELKALVDERVERRLEAAESVDEDDLDRRLDALESRFTDLLKDVRQRVVQVKREADEKAPADHDHPELAAAVETLAGLEDAVEELSGRLDRLEERMEAGFDNYEEVLEYLTDSLEEASARQTTLAQALVETREELRKLAARDSVRSAAADLRREASRHGVRKADCGACERTVDVAMLSRPECPHCSATFVEVDPSSGFFGTSVLLPGDRPALGPGEDPDGGFEHGVAEIIDSDDAPPDVGPEEGETG